MNSIYNAVFAGRPRTRRFLRMQEVPGELEREAARYTRALEQRELARRRRRGWRDAEVEITRNAVPAAVDEPRIEPWEIEGYDEAANLPKNIEVDTVDGEIGSLVRLLETMDHDWEQRTAGLKRLANLLGNDEFRGQFRASHAEQAGDALVLQLTDLRSSLVREASTAIVTCVVRAPDAFQPLAAQLLGAALQLVVKTTKVFRDAGDELARGVIRATAIDEATVQVVCTAVREDPHPAMREHGVRYLEMFLADELGARIVELIDDALMAALEDSAAPVRREARKAFQTYERSSGAHAERLYRRMNDNLKRRVRDQDRSLAPRVPISELRKGGAFHKPDADDTAPTDHGGAVQKHRPALIII